MYEKDFDILYNDLKDFLSREEIEDLYKSIFEARKFFSVRLNEDMKENLRKEFKEYIKGMNFEVMDDPIFKEVVLIKVKGKFDIKMDPRLKRVFVDKYTAEAVMQGIDVYPPGISRSDKNIKLNEYVNILEINTKKFVGIGIVKENFFRRERGKGEAIETIASFWKIPNLKKSEYVLKGYVYPQSRASVYTVYLLEPKENDRILDMCAAPGGKLTLICKKTRNKAKIYAFDKSNVRIEKLKRNIEAQRCNNVEIFKDDSRYIDIKYKFDVNKILLDAPCTATGVRPKVYLNLNEKDLKAIALYQRQFLKVAAKILKKGIIVYSTCSITYEENERNIKWFLKEFPEFEHVDIKPIFGEKGFEDIGIRIFPNKYGDSGYFICVLEK